MPLNMEFYRGRKVLVTGHTGFKGTWLCRMLVNAGAAVTGYALEPPTDPALFDLAGLEGRMKSVTGDIRDLEHLKQTFQAAEPEIVFHLAAQPIVRESYKDPRLTYETNVMGTVNLLECVRETPSVRSVLNVTTDKVYQNNEWCWGYREDEPLERLAADGQLMSYMHRGFWQCMDNMREKESLDKLLAAGKAPWKKWED